MRRFLILLGHEWRALAFSPATYIAAFLFLILMGYVFLTILHESSLEPREALPMEIFFRAYALPVLFMIPLLTMRSLAEERRLGTLDALLSTPVTMPQVVAAKFAAAYGFYLFLWLLSLGFPWLAATVLPRPELAILLLDPGILLGGYAFVAISGLFFVAIGIFSSALTRSQLVAGMLCFTILFIVVVGLPALREQAAGQLDWLGGSLDYLQIGAHLDDFCRGILDSRPLFYYGGNTLVVLGLSVLILESRS